VKNVHDVKKQSIQLKNLLLAVLHGTKLASNAKHVSSNLSVKSIFIDFKYRQYHFNIGFIQRFSTRCLLQKYVFNIWIPIDVLYFIWIGCYQDKLHPHERNRKQLEGKFSKQPGAAAAAAAAEPAAEAAADEE